MPLASLPAAARPLDSQGGDATARRSPALAFLVLAASAALAWLPFVSTAPNRLLSGSPVPLPMLLHGPTQGLARSTVFMLAALFILSLLRAGRRHPGFSGRARLEWLEWLEWLKALFSASLIPLLIALAAAQASAAAQALSPIARTSLGSGFWLALVLAGLMLADALRRADAGGLTRSFAAGAVLVAVAALFAGGLCDSLSLMKEYANRDDVFAQAVARHLQIVGIAMALTLAVGLPLGWAAFRFSRLGHALMPVLNIVQTIPSIALFGLLMAPLAWLAVSVPALGRAGISGVGLAPGVIALTLYSLLPVVRGVLAGLAQVPSGALQAARGMGMSGREVFAKVQVPLAFPVVLGGVRTATIQAIGLAAVTALIGAGGLGSIMFEGLFSNAQDLVLLGVLPVVAMGVVADALFRAAVRVSRPAVWSRFSREGT
jgi:osmoprotectant transport system permease protein